MNLISRNPTSKDRVVTLNTWERLLAALCLTGMLAIANNVAEMELRSNWLDSWLTQEGLIRLPSLQPAFTGKSGGQERNWG